MICKLCDKIYNANALSSCVVTICTNCNDKLTEIYDKNKWPIVTKILDDTLDRGFVEVELDILRFYLGLQSPIGNLQLKESMEKE